MKFSIRSSGNRLSGFPLWIIPPLLLIFIALAVGFNGLYGQDSFEYLRYSRLVYTFFTEGKYPGPFFWPVLYPFAGALFSFILPDILALQLISIACYGLTYYFLGKILHRLFPEEKKEMDLYLLLFFSLSPFIMRYSLTVMSEPMTLFFLTAFFYYWLVFAETAKHKYFLGLVFFGCAAVNTRYPSSIVILIPLLYALYLFIRNFRLGFFFLSVLIAALVFFPAYWLKAYEPGSVFNRPDFAHWTFGNFLKRSFTTLDGENTYLVPNILYVVKNIIHPGYIFPGLVFLFCIGWKRMHPIFLKITSITILVYALFLAGLPFQNDRVLLLTFPLVLIVFSGPFLTLNGKISKVIQSHPLSFRRGGRGVRCLVLYQFIPDLKKFLIISVILVQMVLFYAAFRPFYRNNKITKFIALKMLEYPSKKIYTFNIDMALKGYGVTNETVNLWSSRPDFFEPNALVLFNFADSGKQWKGMNPMLNWENLNRDHHLKLLENFPEGWNLYEITD